MGHSLCTAKLRDCTTQLVMPVMAEVSLVYCQANCLSDEVFRSTMMRASSLLALFKKLRKKEGLAHAESAAESHNVL